MGIFLLTPINNSEALAKKVSSEFGTDAFPIKGTPSLLISWPGTVVELSEKIGLTDGSVGTGVLVSVGNYYGRAPTDIWEWMKVRTERS